MTARNNVLYMNSALPAKVVRNVPRVTRRGAPSRHATEATPVAAATACHAKANATIPARARTAEIARDTLADFAAACDARNACSCSSRNLPARGESGAANSCGSCPAALRAPIRSCQLFPAL